MTKEKIALIVVDLQEDFLPPSGSLAVPNGRVVIEPITSLIRDNKYQWSAVVVTQDWHPRDHTSFASQHGQNPFSTLKFEHPEGAKDETGQVKSKQQVLWPDHCVQNTEGAAIELLFLKLFDNLSANIPKLVVQKGQLKDREYYSCFNDCWQLHETKLKEFFHENGITKAVFTGLAYDYCVLNSAIDSEAANFNTFVVKDCSASVSPDQQASTDEIYRKNGVEIIDLKNLDNLFAN